MPKTFVFGDIHGCRKQFAELMDKINPDPVRDTLVFLGDYIDRGPDSKGVVDELKSLRLTFKKMIALKGNHEDAFLNYLAGREREFFLTIGGRQTLKSYGVVDQQQAIDKTCIPTDHLDFFNNLLPYWEDDKYIYVHAGLQPGVHLSQQSSHWLLWSDGNQMLEQDYDFGKCVVFGHTVQNDPLIRPNRIAVDSGAVFGGRLTCVVLPDEEVVSVKSRKYWPEHDAFEGH